ncbi:hypothetical protein [Herbaspirillum sp. SJZ107]|uniref:hypothetical protein n=1 Tax=Herbaspirillum sp. SJZ107 TaxID=2572881 RepID=UPI0011511273|nr:hypothetical protein [Herbaspirillum sp. SJZ107]TQK03436.1 hypothetical protein FBX97_5004 [Herbaspirillum sp. SJZ107]
MSKNDNAAKTPDPELGGPAKGNGIRQMELDGLVDDVVAGSGKPDAGPDDMMQAPGRMFMPSNRELVIEQLAALVLSPHFPTAPATPVATTRPPFIVKDGLSSTEIDILTAGRQQRFPVLVEVRADAARSSSGAIGVRDVLGLRFRNQGEADDFRCLPFDEMDTAFFPCEAEPALFALDSPVRPRDTEGDAGVLDAHARGEFADRIAGAVCCLLELGAAEPACWAAISDLLHAVPLAEQAAGLELRTLIASTNGPTAGIGDAVARTFMAYEREAPGRLIDEVARRAAESSSDPALTPALSRWLEVARGVLGNRVALNGDILADGGSIPLRAAILAAVVDDVGNLVPFLHADRPAGHRVVTAAALLLGLRTGLRNLSWSRKVLHLDLLSDVVFGLHDDRLSACVKALDGFSLEPDETAAGVEFLLCWRSQVLARWASCPACPDNASNLQSAPLLQADHVDVLQTEEPSAASPASNASFLTAPNGRRIEVIQTTGGSAVISLRVALEEGEKLRKVKEIFEAACRPGIRWRVGTAEDGHSALYMDLPGARSELALQEAAETLSGALAAYVVPPKAPRKKKASASRPRKQGSVTE